MNKKNKQSSIQPQIPSLADISKKFFLPIVIFIIIVVLGVEAGTYLFFKNDQKQKTNEPLRNYVLTPTRKVATPTKKPSATPTVEVKGYDGCINNGGIKDSNSHYPLTCWLNGEEYFSDCAENDKYFVIQTIERDFSVKYKTAKDQEYSCKVSTDDYDYDYKIEEYNDASESIIALVGDFLILDRGCCPGPRGLVIYNLANGKIVFEDTYYQSHEVFYKRVIVSEDNKKIAYWTVTDIEANKNNCPESEENKDYNFIMDELVTLNLPTLSKTRLGVYRCEMTQ